MLRQIVVTFAAAILASGIALVASGSGPSSAPVAELNGRPIYESDLNIEGSLRHLEREKYVTRLQAIDQVVE